MCFSTGVNQDTDAGCQFDLQFGCAIVTHFRLVNFFARLKGAKAANIGEGYVIVVVDKDI